MLLGPSGCGKTTLLRIIAGLETPDAGGRVLFNDTDVTRVPIERRNVGMVFQSYALFPNMNVAENIGYGLKIRGVGDAEREARIAELVALTGIEGLEHRRIDQLSGGQRQRVALARAVAVRPSVLLLDEPLTALDAALRERLRGELNRLLRTLGITTIYVTHDQSRSHGARRPHRGHAQRRDRADRNAARHLFHAGESLRRRIRRRRQYRGGGCRRRHAACCRAANCRSATRQSVPATCVRDDPAGIDQARRARRRRSVGPGRQRQLCRRPATADRSAGAAQRPIMVDVPNTIDIKVGDRVGLTIDPAAIRLLPGEARDRIARL